MYNASTIDSTHYRLVTPRHTAIRQCGMCNPTGCMLLFWHRSLSHSKRRQRRSCSSERWQQRRCALRSRRPYRRHNSELVECKLKVSTPLLTDARKADQPNKSRFRIRTVIAAKFSSQLDCTNVYSIRSNGHDSNCLSQTCKTR